MATLGSVAFLGVVSGRFLVSTFAAAPWWSLPVAASAGAMGTIALCALIARLARTEAVSKVSSICYLLVVVVAPLTYLASAGGRLSAPEWMGPLLLGLTFLSAGLYLKAARPESTTAWASSPATGHPADAFRSRQGPVTESS
jgi:hypothetical protein